MPAVNRPPITGISYPDLPITERRDELLATIEGHQVVIVAGETGSGKSTQLPKLCLELGRGSELLIGHTQPRRIAARSVAERVASELRGEVGGTIGYAVRFTDEVGPDTRVKLMTDGILLADIQRDRNLGQYDTLIVDEAHERSLNIDFLLGYLKQLLPRRQDLKLIITSATIDTERFSQHFSGAPIIEVSGRAYPVELRYEPLEDNSTGITRDQPAAIVNAVTELFSEGDGDVLVFCSGEREIRDAAEELRELALPNTEILPLYARLSANEQHRVFSSHRGRRVVLATNVAETSLTVPGIRYVVDPGNARLSRYNRRTKVQRLPIEAISQASANQRAGRCGRLGPGICIRLYSQQDYLDRPEFTEPEVQRTNLASVILQMAALGLGDIEKFPFVDPPDHRNIRDGIALLEELDAVDPDHQGTRRWLTGIGRQLARLPVDPRLGRMVLAAKDHGCLWEVMIIAAGLSVQDPRERPTGSEQQADEMHARFIDPASDFVGFVNLWKYLAEQRKEHSSNQFRRLCKAEYINYRRVREWQDIHRQLRRITNELKLRANKHDASPDEIHRALLTGLLSHIGQKDPDTHEYRGARGSRFAVARGSAIFKKAPRWVMAGELVETNRLWARNLASVQTEWIEDAAEHLVRRSYDEPWWDGEQGLAMTHERVSLYGLPLVAGRTVPFRRADHRAAREMFIRHALVEGDWHGKHDFRVHNRRVAEEARSLEAMARQRDILAGDETLIAFFDERVGPDVTSAQSFETWWKKTRSANPELLHLKMDEVLDPVADDIDRNEFPSEWRYGDQNFPITYEFDPYSPRDGITIDIPAPLLRRVDPSTFEWLVPGLREELVTFVIRSLPKQYRKQLVPIPDTVRELLPQLDPGGLPLAEALRKALSERLGQPLPADLLGLENLPTHLQPTFRATNTGGDVIAENSDLDVLRGDLHEARRGHLAAGNHPIEKVGLTTWDLDDLPKLVELGDEKHSVAAYPALVDEGTSVAIHLLATESEQLEAMWTGTRRLLLLELPTQARSIRGLITNKLSLALSDSPYASTADWYHDCMACSVDALIRTGGGPPWTLQAWQALLDHVRLGLHDNLHDTARSSARILIDLAAINQRLASDDQERHKPSISDISGQLSRLIHPSMLATLGADRLADLSRYIRGISHRLDRLSESWKRDNQLMLKVLPLENEYDRLVGLLSWTPMLEDLGWMLQELRISLFAQSVGAKGPISEKRVRAALEKAGLG